MNFEVGQVLNFSWTGNLFQKLIKRFTGKWTHSAIIGGFANKDGVECAIVYEALDNGFSKNYYEVWWLNARLNDGTLAVGTSKVKLNKVWDNCEKYLGRPYGWLDILRISRIILTRGKSVDTYDSDKNLICSEAVARVLYDSSNKKLVLGYKNYGEKSEFNKPFDLITPTDLFNSKNIKWEVKNG